MKHFAITEALRYELANLAGMLGKVELSQELMAAPLVEDSVTREEWMDTFFTLCQAKGVKVADEVALRMCVAGYTPADALARYLVLNPK